MLIELMLLALQQQPAILLRLDPAIGTAVRYRNMVRGAQLSWSVESSQTVIGRTDSTTVWEVRTDTVTLAVMGQMDHSPASVDTMVVSRRGSLLSQTQRVSLPAGLEHLALALPSPPLFPDYPVRPGVTWRRGESTDSLVSIETDSLGRVVATIHTLVRTDGADPIFGVPLAGRGEVMTRYDLTRGLLLLSRFRTVLTGSLEGENVTQTFEQISELIP